MLASARCHLRVGGLQHNHGDTSRRLPSVVCRWGGSPWLDTHESASLCKSLSLRAAVGGLWN